MMKGILGRILTILAFASVISACSSTTVVLLPDGNESSQVTISTEVGSQTLTTPGSATTASSTSSQPDSPKVKEIEQIKQKHASLFSIHPEEAQIFLLYFQHNDVKLLPKSEKLMLDVIAKAKQRINPIINIIGHTDASGNSDYNMSLSIKRAKAVEKRLKAADISGATYRIDSYGENDPLIKSNRQYVPQNRRVEVQIW
ncbi:OmpA family protein [Vibrio hannami]|uniref:OmpA family protein n=1 Tax=Vibrio hannami TaxID=2717094 RepID=UPI00240F249A|nr:OmpA family protein [Vibrio hannami]MDG3085818.1 OmpA family protein [Vibrio hannami]